MGQMGSGEIDLRGERDWELLVSGRRFSETLAVFGPFGLGLVLVPSGWGLFWCLRVGAGFGAFGLGPVLDPLRFGAFGLGPVLVPLGWGLFGTL